MQNLPTAETYAKEVMYMPWGILIGDIQKIVLDRVPQGGNVVDLMCGTGNLLGELYSKRSDVKYTGVDLEADYIDYAKRQYPNINFEVKDAIIWQSDIKYDAVLCTGGLHHLPYEKQEEFLRKVSSLVKEGGFAIVADPYIPDYSNEQERKISAVNLGCKYLIATIKNNATDDIIKATADLIPNDVLLVEFKTSVEKIKPQFNRSFTNVEIHKTWGEDGYGDYYFICSNKQ